MSGSVSVVQTRMNERQNGFIYTHCTADWFESAVTDSIKFDNYLNRLDEILSLNFAITRERRKSLNDLPLLFDKNFNLDC